MSAYLSWSVYCLVALIFSWLAWRSIWASAPKTLPRPSADREAHPIVIWLHMIFYAGMASFEVTVNLGL